MWLLKVFLYSFGLMSMMGLSLLVMFGIIFLISGVFSFIYRKISGE